MENKVNIVSSFVPDKKPSSLFDWGMSIKMTIQDAHVQKLKESKEHLQIILKEIRQQREDKSKTKAK